LILFKRLW